MSLNLQQCQGERDKSFGKHLTKDERSPKLFRDVARVLREVKSKKSSIKNAVYAANIRRCVFNKVYALTFSVFKYLKVIDKVIEDLNLLKKEPGLNLEVAEILIHEVCVAKKTLHGVSKPVLVIQKYMTDVEKSFVKHMSVSSSELDSSAMEKWVPRYARVNTLVTDVSEVISALKRKSYYEVVYDDGITLDEYHDIVKQLQPYEFTIDFHFKDLLVFVRSQNLSFLNLYKNGHIFLQDKSSYIPVHVLSPPPGSVVFDACAAPGMKTVHIAACMNNTGEMFATDHDEKRFEVLKETLKLGSVSICKSCCCNFTDVNPHDEEFAAVEYILVDPSCSGSGMVGRMDHVTDDEHSKNENRLLKLAGFQITVLKHALSFPSAKRVVYSTCSLSETENEYVIQEALNHYQHLYQIVEALPHWPTRGQGDYKFSHLCVRSFPESNFTNGFFVAVFERLQDVENNLENTNGSKKKKNKSSFGSIDGQINCTSTESVVKDSIHCQALSHKDKRSKMLLKMKDKCKSDTNETVKSHLKELQIAEFSCGNYPLHVNNNCNFAENVHENLGEICHVKQNVYGQADITTVKHHKKKHKHVDYANCSSQENINKKCDEHLYENQTVEEQTEVAMLKKHKKKKHGHVERSPDESQDVKEHTEEPADTSIVKKHKKKKHKVTESTSDELSKKKKHGDVKRSPDESQDVKEHMEEETNVLIIKRHKKKKCKDTESTFDEANKKEKHKDIERTPDESEYVMQCMGKETTILKKHKKKKHKHTEITLDEPNKKKKHEVVEKNCNEIQRVEQSMEIQTDTTILKRHKKKKHKDLESTLDKP